MGAMLALLAVAPALATEFALLGGLVAGSGHDGERFDYTSWSPQVAVTASWHFAFLEAWAGGSSSALMAQRDLQVVPAAAFLAEAGAGFGSPSLAFGGYVGAGIPAREWGVYGRFDLPRRKGGSLRAVGGELRLAYIASLDMGVASALVRVELGRERRERRPRQAAEPPIYHPDPFAD